LGLKLTRQGDYIRLETPAGNAYTMSQSEAWMVLADLDSLVHGLDRKPNKETPTMEELNNWDLTALDGGKGGYVFTINSLRCRLILSDLAHFRDMFANMHDKQAQESGVTYPTRTTGACPENEIHVIGTGGKKVIIKF